MLFQTLAPLTSADQAFNTLQTGLDKLEKNVLPASEDESQKLTNAARTLGADYAANNGANSKPQLFIERLEKLQRKFEVEHNDKAFDVVMKLGEAFADALEIKLKSKEK